MMLLAIDGLIIFDDECKSIHNLVFEKCGLTFFAVQSVCLHL